MVQLINYGLEGEKLSEKILLAEWESVKVQLDIDNRKVIEFLLWGEKWKGEPGLAADRNNFLTWLHGRRESRKIIT